MITELKCREREKEDSKITRLCSMCDYPVRSKIWRGRRVGGGEGEKEKDIKVHTEMDKYLILFLPLECKCWRTET